MGLLGGQPRPRPRSRTARCDGAVNGKTVVITGASSGIGQVGGAQGRAAGGIPLLVARGKDKLEETKAEIEAARRHRATSTPATSPTSRRSTRSSSSCSPTTPAIDFARQQRRPLDPPLARAQLRPLPRLRAHDAAQLLRRDPAVMGLLPHMREQQRGHVVNVSSIGVQTNPPRFSAYVASKAALDAWTHVVSSELIGDGVTLHHDPHAAGAHADDRADEDLRQVPDDLARRGRRPGLRGDPRASRSRSTPRSARSARSRTRWRRRPSTRSCTWPTRSSRTRPPRKGEKDPSRRRRQRADRAGQPDEGRALVGMDDAPPSRRFAAGIALLLRAGLRAAAAARPVPLGARVRLEAGAGDRRRPLLRPLPRRARDGDLRPGGARGARAGAPPLAVRVPRGRRLAAGGGPPARPARAPAAADRARGGRRLRGRGASPLGATQPRG